MRESTRKLVMRVIEHVASACGWAASAEAVKAAAKLYDDVELDAAGTDDGVVDAIGLLLEEIDRLHEIVERLPITADGVRVLPGDRVWYKDGGGRDVFYDDMGRQLRVYSTSEAAMRALESQKGS